MRKLCAAALFISTSLFAMIFTSIMVDKALHNVVKEDRLEVAMAFMFFSAGFVAALTKDKP